MSRGGRGDSEVKKDKMISAAICGTRLVRKAPTSDAAGGVSHS